MEFGPINLMGGAIVLLMLLPNIIYAIRFRDAENQCRSRFLNTIEQVGRYASMALMILPLGVWEFSFASVAEMLIYVFGSGTLLLAYYILWGCFFRRQTPGVSMALAVIPAVIFLLCGLTLRHWLLVLAAILFAAGHIGVTKANTEA